MDKALLKTAFIWAEQSKCKRLKVGAVIAKESRIISIGFNGTPSGLYTMEKRVKVSDNDCEKVVKECECGFKFSEENDLVALPNDLFDFYNCPNCGKTLEIKEMEKIVYKGYNQSFITNPNVIHSEMNALMFAAKQGISTEGATMYITHSPCINCAKHILQAGIKRVVYEKDYREDEGLKLLKSMIEVKQMKV